MPKSEGAKNKSDVIGKTAFDNLFFFCRYESPFLPNYFYLGSEQIFSIFMADIDFFSLNEKKFPWILLYIRNILWTTLPNLKVFMIILKWVLRLKITHRETVQQSFPKCLSIQHKINSLMYKYRKFHFNWWILWLLVNF